MQKRNKRNYFNIYLIALFFASVFMCIGYATVNNVSLDLVGSANIKAEPRIFIFDADIDGNSDANISASSIDLYYDTMLQSTVVLNNDVDSTLSMEITIKNTTSNNAYFEEVAYGNNFYDNNNIDFTLTGLEVNQKLAAHGSITFTITFKYTDQYIASNPSTFTNTLNSYLNFKFGTGDYVARIGSTDYMMLTEAWSDAMAANTTKTIELLKDYSLNSILQVNDTKSVIVDLAGHNITTSAKTIFQVNNGGTFELRDTDSGGTITGGGRQGNKQVPTIVNKSGGTVTITSGNVTSDAGQVVQNEGTMIVNGGSLHNGNVDQGIINNVSGGTLYVNGGTITNNAGRQAIYNNGGTLYITGGTLSNNTNQRAAVHNLANGSVTITGGTITAGSHAAVNNESGTLTLGTENANVSTTSPSLRGGTYGVMSQGSINYYDGVVRGHTAAFDDETKVVDQETGYDILHSTETISGTTYDTAILAQGITVTFDGNGGTPSQNTKTVAAGTAIGTLPTATRTAYDFQGWFDDPTGGTQITSSYIVNSADTFYAHWTLTPVNYAKIGGTEYETLADAWDAAMASNNETIELLKDCSVTSILQVNNSKNVTVDLKGHTINTSVKTVFEVNNGGSLVLKDTAGGGSVIGGGNNGGTQAPPIVNKSGGTVTINGGTVHSDVGQVIDNTGTMNITGGTISIGNYAQGVVNNNAGGVINMSGGTISSTYNVQKSQAIYNAGTVNLSGTATLTSACSQRATVHNYASGARLTMSGGTINSTNTSNQKGAIENVSGATVEITGGTVISASTKNNTGAVLNAGTLTVGNKDGNINTSSPVLQGAKYGVYNNSVFNFYDGTIKGISATYNGTPSDLEDNSQEVTGTESIGGKTYHTVHLE